MPIPYHTHTFEIPTATKQEVAAGIVTDKVVVPATLGSASTANTGDFATAEQGKKADNAVPTTLKITAGDGLNGGGALASDIKIELSEITKNSLKKADGAFPASDAGDLAKKSKVLISDITATGTANNSNFLRGDGTWAAPDTSAADMRKSVYDPRDIGKDVFNSDNITQGNTHLFLTSAERTAIADLKNADNITQGNTHLFLTSAERTAIADLKNTDNITQGNTHLFLTSAERTAIADLKNADNITQGNTHLFLTPAERQAIAKALNSQNSLVGMAAPFHAINAPDDWLKENGALVSRATYPLLWAFAQASGALVSEAEWANGQTGCFSRGNGTSTFRLPDARGEFIRGLDDGRGVDVGRMIGSLQLDAFKAHDHGLRIQPRGGSISSWFVDGGNQGTGPVKTEVTGGSETRPRNIALLYCIRYQ